LLLATNGVSRLTLNSAGATFKCYGKQFSNYNSTNNFKWYTTLLTYNAAKAIESVPYNNVAASANSILLTGAIRNR
jgi:hypothetical protein